MVAEDIDARFHSEGRALFVRCARLLGDAQAGARAAEVLFVRLLVHARLRPDDASARRRWIARVATNYCIHRLVAGSAGEFRQWPRAMTDAGLDPAKLGALDEATANAVALAAVDRATADEIADVLALPKSRVERQLGDRAVASSEHPSRLALAEQTVLVRALDLERLLGRPVAANFSPPTSTDEPSPARLAIDRARETTRALESSPQLRALRAGIALSELDVRVAAALVRPQLDFVGSVGAAGRRPDLEESLQQTARVEAPTWSAGLAFQWPVQNRAARGAALAAQATADGARIDVADLELAIRDAVVRSAGAADTAARRLELARAAVEYAGKSLEAERARFEVGRATNNDVLLRQQELKSAEIQVARASIDQALAEAALGALSGDILDRYRLVLK